MADAFFRANVGACLIDECDQVLALKRKGVAENSWQMPQGGIQEGESPRQAILRELGEEIGLGAADVEVLAERPDWLVYELPEEYRRPKVGWGQVQKWFLLRVMPDAIVNPDGKEFEAYEWLTPTDLMPRVVPFRKPVYERVLADFLGRLSEPGSGGGR
jgi:putative (di)nucleoside polyphosphate hydrolase